MVNQVSCARPLEDIDLVAAYQAAREVAGKELEREDITSYSSVETYLLQLSDYSLDILRRKYAENDAASTTYNKTLLQELCSEQEKFGDDPASISGDGAQNLQDYLTLSRDTVQSIVTQYKARALGPRKSAVLNSFLINTMIDGIFEWGSAVKTFFRSKESAAVEEIASVQQGLRSVEAKVHAAQEMLAQEKDSYEKAVQSIKERITTERSTLQDEIQSKQAEIDRTQLQVERLTALHKEALDRLDAQIEEAKNERKRLETDVRAAEARRETERQEAQRQLLESERNYHNEEKGLLQGQQQFMLKVLELERQLGEQDTNQIAELFDIEKKNQEEISQLTLQHQDEQEELKESAIQVRFCFQTCTGFVVI
ncbi:unnamed protein product [Phytophthora lilii]|uniref:Unnamed protein product n=1 Tax=Phytophthora lilii TaxID=2077276 RepID=A0A9W6WM34_9STRA|nr:unnamed protein product [Phytophthora lilii]